MDRFVLQILRPAAKLFRVRPHCVSPASASFTPLYPFLFSHVMPPEVPYSFIILYVHPSSLQLKVCFALSASQTPGLASVISSQYSSPSPFDRMLYRLPFIQYSMQLEVVYCPGVKRVNPRSAI